MTRTRSGEAEGCDNDKMECTDEDKCLGKHHNKFALFTLGGYYELSA